MHVKTIAYYEAEIDDLFAVSSNWLRSVDHKWIVTGNPSNLFQNKQFAISPKIIELQ